MHRLRNLFTPEGLKLLREFLSNPKETLCAFDFDGTLAPIVSDPSLAQMAAAVLERLHKLSELGNVVIISGRSLLDLEARIACKRISVAGSHGAESEFVPPDLLKVTEGLSNYWRHTLLPILDQFPGVFLEDKQFSLALHYRHSLQPLTVLEDLLAVVAQLKPTPRVLFGKYVINLVRSDLPHKGMALSAFQVKFSCKKSVFVGDDITDEDVFALETADIFKVRVGDSGATKADFFIENQSQILGFLDILLQIYSSPH